MSNEFVRNFAIEQRKRLVGSIMTHAERSLYPHLPPEVQREFRDKVMAAVGAYHDATLDMLKASISDGSVVNERALELLQEIHTGTQRLTRDLDGHPLGRRN